MSCGEPEIDGVEVVRLLATTRRHAVYLARQLRPSRVVVLKVALIGPHGALVPPANVAAELSAHPAIVTVLDTGWTRDARPYVLLEYCPHPPLAEELATTSRSIPAVLAMAIQLAGALESAHRAGVLHHCLSPARVLLSGYGRPVLIGFGSRRGTEPPTMGEAPWAPPEAFDDPVGNGVQRDIYSLAATTYGLAAGHAPFAAARPRDLAELTEAIRTAPPPRPERPDAPDALRRALATALAKDPAERYPSALDFARDLQLAETETGRTPTPIDVIETREYLSDSEDDTDPGTEPRRPMSLRPARRPRLARRPTVAGVQRIGRRIGLRRG